MPRPNTDEARAARRKRYAENRETGEYAQVMRYRAKNPQKHLDYRRQWEKKNRDHCNQRMAEWRKANPERWADIQRKATVTARAKKIAKQEKIAQRQRPDICDVCKSPGIIAWDHCHVSGKFRGWLCGPCNLALGNVRDNPATLEALASYLRKV